MIIGLTGIIGSGKGTVADILVKDYGFIYTSLSDVIREEIRNNGEEVTRETLTKTAKRLRGFGGPSIFAEMLIKKLNPSKNYIVDSFRHPEEVIILKEFYEKFVLVNVSAPLEVCLERIKSRNRENDPKTIDELKAQLDKENNDNNQRLDDTINVADFEIINDKGLDELKTEIKILVNNLNNNL
ncbi:hypothetical protein BVX95_01815 [archaeon D22]|nr:hypothetical protein BVX95_01815 [archaeon D22]